jgi:hypothetical protein
VTETAAASETASVSATAPRKRILIVCPNSWDEAQLAAARPRREGTYELLFHGQDAEDDPASFPLPAFVDEAVERYGGRIDGVASSSDYPGCLVAAAVARALGLPGPAPEALLRCEHCSAPIVDERTLEVRGDRSFCCANCATASA